MRPSVVRAGMVLAAAVALAGTVVAVHRGRDHAWPDHWDSRILTYVQFVEQHRGLRYSHAVRVEFLDDATFKNRLGIGEKLSAKDDAELRRDEGIFRALGLLQGDVDLRKQIQQVNEEGIIGEYEPDHDVMLIRGDHITSVMQPTIVHEMTHALQAQHFDLKPPKNGSSGAQLAYRALVEADALAVEDEYVKSLSDAQQEEIDKGRQEQSDAADLKGVPPILTELLELPYAVGPAFRAALAHDGGLPRVNRAFRERPGTEQDIVEPAVYLSGRAPEPVDVPTLRAGEVRSDDPDDFGMVSLLLVLGERVPFADAWDAVHNWRGDNSVTYRAGDKDCIRIHVTTSGDAQATRLGDVARSWAAGRPAEVAVTGHDVELSSCDPGASAAAPTDTKRPRTFEVLTARSQLMTILMDQGLAAGVAECGVDATLRTEDPAAFLTVMHTDDENDPHVAPFRSDLLRAVRGCGGPSTS